MRRTKRIKKVLKDLIEGRIELKEAEKSIEELTESENNLGFAKIDIRRTSRCGFPEVIFCPGKTIEQIKGIFEKLAESGENVLATRAGMNIYEEIKKIYPKARYNELARTISLIQKSSSRKTRGQKEGKIGIICAGTADLPVAEEAKETLIVMGIEPKLFYDVGVAGLHRLINHIEQIRKLEVAIVIAGMEGALPSVVGGLVDIPVIAVPTSIGYGASFNGLAALLGMLNSCTPNVTVVNIDNGFSAGVVASLIVRKKR